MTIWKDPKHIERSKINSRNRRGSENAVAQGTHTGGSITIGELRKRLWLQIFLGRHVNRTQLEVSTWLLKRVKIQHQVSYICMSIHMVMMENLLLVSEHELSMRNIRKHFKIKQSLNLMLTSFKHFTKLREVKKKEEYMVLDLKQSYFMDRIFVPLLDLMLQLQYHL